MSEDESGPLALSEPTSGSIVCDEVLVGVTIVIGVALARGVGVIVGVGVAVPTVIWVWARNAPVAMSVAVTVTCEIYRVAGKWKLPLIVPFLSDTVGVSNNGINVVPIRSIRFTRVPPGNQLVPVNAMLAPP